MENRKATTERPARSGNPIVPGRYADPEARIVGGEYWIYPTVSAPYEEQTFFDAFRSKDLVQWTKVPRILTADDVGWAHKAMWAPSPIERNGKIWYFFAANDIQSDDEVGGIGVAVADRPEGPFRDALGAPLIDRFHHGAQPIDPHAFVDDDGKAYLYYGGWGHCNVALLNDEMNGFIPFADGETFKEVTPEGFVEGPCMIKRAGRYYFMWAEGGWTGPDYAVAYAVADSPLGPFRRVRTILQQHPGVATGAGHHGFLNVPGTDEWYIVYHRRPLGVEDRHHRVLCIDRLVFDEDGLIAPVTITFEGVEARPLE